MKITDNDLSHPQVITLLQEHLEHMASVSPPESKHALDLSALQQPEISFWTLWFSDQLAACAALKELTPEHGEIKSMRTSSNQVRKGAAGMLLKHIIEQAKQRGYQRLSLETGSMSYFKPAHKLYTKYGFVACPPFANYRPDPNSIFMRLDL